MLEPQALFFALVYAILSNCHFRYAQPYTQMFHLSQLHSARRALITVDEHVLVAATPRSIPIGAIMNLAFAKRQDHFWGEVKDA